MAAMHIVMMILGALLLASGCVSSAGYEASESSMPHIPPRPAGATYPNWEHLCIFNGDVDQYRSTLSRAGAEGWELVGQERLELCFKRPVHPPVDATPGAPASPESEQTGAAPAAVEPASDLAAPQPE